MQWIQTRRIEGTYVRFSRFKCNRCGTTQEVSYDSASAEGGRSLPNGWTPGLHEGWHFCPGCKEPRRTALPVV